jgi:methyl-accepting chemotaxis protein
MRRLSDWPVLARVLGGFALTCVLIAVIVAISWTSFTSTRDDSAKLERVGSTLLSIANAKATLEQIHGNMATYVTSVIPGRPANAQSIQTHDAFVKGAAQLAPAKMAAMFADLTPAERTLAAPIAANVKQFVASDTAAWPFYLKGDTKKGQALLGKYDAYNTHLDASLASNRLITAVQKRYAATAQRVQDQTGSARRTVAILGIVALLLAIATGIVLARSIKRPAQEMLVAAEGLAQGDVDQRITLDSRDELGRTAAALRGVIDYQQGLAAVAGRVADGDLTVRVQPKSERDVLGTAFAGMIDSVREVVTRMAATAGNLSAASQQMATTSEEAGRAVGEIASAVGEVAAGAERQVRTVDGARAAAEETARAATHASELADGGATAAAEASRAMDAVNASSAEVTAAIRSLASKSDQIGGIVSTITGIAEQTNLLALNAAIEAARAGEQGRGFAVVAEEVRKLAEESQQAAGTIAGLIGQIQGETGSVVAIVESGAVRSSEGAATVEQAREAFELIGAAVKDVSQRIAAIAEATQEVAAVAEQSSATTEEVSASTEQTSASTQQIAASAQELARTAEELEVLVGRFQVV